VSINFGSLLTALATRSVDFIVVGGIAAAVRGASRATYDLDVVYARTPRNLDRVIEAIAPFDPYLRGAPRGLPFRWERATLERGLNFTLVTSAGDLDLLGEIVGGGRYDDLLPQSTNETLFGVDCRCLSLEALIAVKRAAGRPKDLEAIAELEAIRDERHAPDSN
jgi:hypothetical protein